MFFDIFEDVLKFFKLVVKIFLHFLFYLLYFRGSLLFNFLSEVNAAWVVYIA